jgi:hypothetical protein
MIFMLLLLQGPVGRGAGGGPGDTPDGLGFLLTEASRHAGGSDTLEIPFLDGLPPWLAEAARLLAGRRLPVTLTLSPDGAGLGLELDF